MFFLDNCYAIKDGTVSLSLLKDGIVFAVKNDGNNEVYNLRKMSGFKNLYMPETLLSFNIKFLFYDNIYISPNIEEIGPNAFYYCSNLNNIFLPKSLKKLGTNAIPRKTIIYYEGSKEDFNNIKCEENIFKNKIIYNITKEHAVKLGLLSSKQVPNIVNEEKIEETNLSMDWDNILGTNSNTDGIYADTIPEGLILSLRNLGYVDIEYIANITGSSLGEVIFKLKGVIYQDPLIFDECYYKGFKTSDDYLSGNILKKLKIAREYNKKYPGLFEENIKALEILMPKSVAYEEIFYQMSSTWLPKDIINHFLMRTFGLTLKKIEADIFYDNVSKTYEVKGLFDYNPKAYIYETKRIKANKILEHALNGTDIFIYDGVKENKKLNEVETFEAMNKLDMFNNKFIEFCEDDSKIKKEIEDSYNERFGYNVIRKYNGDFLDFKGLNPNVTLYRYQKDAVARILLSKNTLLAHDVGTGKTFIIAASIMELRRMKQSPKNMVVVPNSIIGQWRDIFKNLYPNANILVIDAKVFKKSMREEVIKKIRDNDYDAIIIGYSSFELIPVSKKIRKEHLEDLLSEYDNIEASRLTKTMLSARERIIKKIKKIDNEEEAGLFFDDLGITRLFIDEAHNFKNIPLKTKIHHVLGINPEGSNKCLSMLDKVDLINKNIHGGVIMATGTPITNSITDCYVFQRYLQPSELKLLDIETFDSWISMFAEKSKEFEIDVDTTKFRMCSRFARFHNLPELTSILSMVSDFYQQAEVDDLPKFNGHTDIVVKKSNQLEAYLKILSARAEMVRSHLIDTKFDNMLKITTDGRKAALDTRLVHPDFERVIYLTQMKSGKVKVKDKKTIQQEFLEATNNLSIFKQNPYENKIKSLAKEVSRIYYETIDSKATQLIFLDTSISSNKFNLYDEIKRTLTIDYNLPYNDVSYIHDAVTDKEKDDLMNKVNEGAIRVLIGSTAKLGTGVNVQKKLIAIHHFDVPWRPSDMVQREGRIIRQGNTNKEVYIYRYIAESSFDSYSWQLLETKQAFISELLANSLNERTKQDVSDTLLDYAEVKALALGNSRIKDRVLVQNRINELTMLEKRIVEEKANASRELLEIPKQLSSLKELSALVLEDSLYYEAMKREYHTEERKKLALEISQALDDNILQDEERHLTVYQGFDIILPKRMLETTKSIIVSHNSRYTLPINKELGIVVKIDNYLERLDKRYDEIIEKIAKLKNKQSGLKRVKDDPTDYTLELKSLSLELKKIDKELNISNV